MGGDTLRITLSDHSYYDLTEWRAVIEDPQGQKWRADGTSPQQAVRKALRIRRRCLKHQCKYHGGH